MSILITGANGQLGSELMTQCDASCTEASRVDLPEFDITDTSQVDNIIDDVRPAIVINAAAYTNVDGAETEKETAFKVNSDAPAYLAKVCSKKNIPLIHISTDYVFNGESEHPYKETDPVSPINEYGRSKLQGETNIQSELKEHIIIRTSWLYGVKGHNFVKTMLRLGKEKESLNVVNDQFGSPTYAADLAEAALTIAAKIHSQTDIKWGTYHFCNQGVTSWHGFAEAIFDIAGAITPMKIKQIQPVSSEEFASSTNRPAYSALDCRWIQEYFDIHPKPWRRSLERMIFRFFNEESTS